MSHKKVQQILAGLVMVMVLAAVPVSAEAESVERQVETNVASAWSAAMEWLAERWSGIGKTLAPSRPQDKPRHGRAHDQDKKGSMLDPNG